MRDRKSAAAVASALLAASVLAHASAEIDPAFGSAGEATVAFTTLSVFHQPDGRLVLAGNAVSTDFFRGLPFGNVVRVSRLLPDGLVDASFSGSPFGTQNSSLRSAAALQPDGRIVLVASYPQSFLQETRITRLHPDGSVDTSFGDNGLVTLGYQYPYAIALQSDGRILVALYQSLARFNADGSSDASFGNGGSVTLPPVDVAALRVDGSNRALVLFARDAQLRRFDPDGSTDLSFNGGTAIAAAGATGMDLALLADGAILVAGQSGPANNPRGMLLRFSAAGALDPAFGQGGRVETVNPGSVASVVIEPAGSIVGFGGTLMRWRANGTPEGRVGWLGRIATPLRVLRQADGRLVTASAYSVSLGGNATAGYTSLLRHGTGSFDMFSDARLFARQQYRDFLGREGEQAGVDFWQGELATGARTRAQIVEEFFNSTEFQLSIAPLVRLYLAYFLRYPDWDGLNYWLGHLKAGNSLEAVSQNFALSPEFFTRYGLLDNSRFVARVYQNVLGRAEDAAGRAFWINQLDIGAVTRGQMMLAFSEGAEFRALSANDVYVTMIYAGMLRRMPDPAGYSFWVSYMDSGSSGLALIDGFLQSTEYRNRFLP